MTLPSTKNAPHAKASIAPIVTGVLVAALGYVVALAQGMASAPSGWGGMIGTGLFLLGCALAGLGLVAIWVIRLRPVARSIARVVIVLLVLCVVVERIASALTAEHRGRRMARAGLVSVRAGR